jgi:hypothetical protein
MRGFSSWRTVLRLGWFTVTAFTKPYDVTENLALRILFPWPVFEQNYAGIKDS